MTDARTTIRQAYDAWAASYDSNENPTRDLNATVTAKERRTEDPVVAVGVFFWLMILLFIGVILFGWLF